MLGTWRAHCDFGGEPVYAHREVLAARATGERALDVLFGLAWTDATGDMHSNFGGEVVAAWPAGHRARWTDDRVTISGAADDGADLEVEALVPGKLTTCEVDPLVEAHIAPALLAAGFLVVPGTWVRDWSGMEGEVLANRTAEQDRQMRRRPTDDQLTAAHAALDAAPAADHAVVALALPGKLHEPWAVGQRVEAVGGLWLSSDTGSGSGAPGAPLMGPSTARAAAEAAAAAHLVTTSRVGTTCRVQIGRDGTWSAVEGRRVHHGRSTPLARPAS